MMDKTILHPRKEGKTMTIHEYFDGLQGFFSYAKDHGLRMVTEDNASELDLDYDLRSGSREVSQRCYSILQYGRDRTDLYPLILNKYMAKWNRSWDALNADYEALENYSMTERENVASDVNGSSTTKTGVYGFNSEDAVPTATSDSETSTIGAKEKNERNLIRSGRTGSKTPQEMILDELETRKRLIVDIVYDDLDSYLASQYWEE